VTEPEHPMVAFPEAAKDPRRRASRVRPSSIMERLVLQVVGGWENVICEVNR
jgi:hypothetical protein